MQMVFIQGCMFLCVYVRWIPKICIHTRYNHCRFTKKQIDIFFISQYGRTTLYKRKCETFYYIVVDMLWLQRLKAFLSWMNRISNNMCKHSHVHNRNSHTHNCFKEPEAKNMNNIYEYFFSVEVGFCFLLHSSIHLLFTFHSKCVKPNGITDKLTTTTTETTPRSVKLSYVSM